MFNTVNIDELYKKQKKSSLNTNNAFTNDYYTKSSDFSSGLNKNSNGSRRNSNPFVISSVDYEDDSITKTKVDHESNNSKEIVLDFDSK